MVIYRPQNNQFFLWLLSLPLSKEQLHPTYHVIIFPFFFNFLGPLAFFLKQEAIEIQYATICLPN